MGPHVCDNCGRRSEWGKSWRWFGSHADMDEDAIARTCSPTCRAQTTDAELEQLVHRRRDRRGTDDLTPLREHREHTPPAAADQTALF
jgi:hypothetical protein